MALRTYFLTPANEPKLTNPDEVHETIWGLKVCKAPGPYGTPNRALKHLPPANDFPPGLDLQCCTPHPSLPQVWKHARVISILKPGKDTALSHSYRHISLLDTIGKLFEEILLSRILQVVSERGMMRDEQFLFGPRHRTSLHVDRLVKN